MEPILDAPVYERTEIVYAGFWIRVGAYLLDAVILQVLVVPCMLLMAAIGSESASVFVVILIVIGVLLYFPFLESSEKQATFGKQIVGIKVGDEHGDRISFANALGRFFSKILSGMILYIGYIMIAFDSKNQGLHDKIANTYVFYK